MSSGDTLLLLIAESAQFPASNYGTPDNRSNTIVVAFDDTLDESVEFAGFMPSHYAGGGVTLTLGYMAASASSGTVSLNVAFKSMTDDVDAISKAFAAANNVNSTTASASGEIKYQTIAFTDGADMDSVAAGEWFKLKFERDANSTSSTDNLVGDIELVFISIEET